MTTYALGSITIKDPERPGRKLRVLDDSPAHVADILALRAHCERVAADHRAAWLARPTTHPSDGTHARLLAPIGQDGGRPLYAPLCRADSEASCLRLGTHLHGRNVWGPIEPNPRPDTDAIRRLAAALTARKAERHPATAPAAAHATAKPARAVRPVPAPAPALAPAPARAPSSADRPTCERCGKTFRRSGVGLAWHRANNPHCARRASLAVAS